MHNKKILLLFLTVTILVCFFSSTPAADQRSYLMPILSLLLFEGKDCNGVKHGAAYFDNCNICVGGDTHELGCTKDCNGDWGGLATIDNCGVCDNNPTNNNITCVEDCIGVWGGAAYVDDCNACVGGNTGGTACVRDCRGDWGGTATNDNCGVCDDIFTNNNTTCTADCTGVWGGTAYVDDCNICVGGDTGKTPCDLNEIDNDNDGYTENQGDCDDSESSIHPNIAEICGDNIDQDCNGNDMMCGPNQLPRPYFSIFLPLRFDENITDIVKARTELASDYNFNVVNLVVHWGDIEPNDNDFRFEELHSLITEIKTRGLVCSLRFYFHGGVGDDISPKEIHESPPSWFFEQTTKDVDYYETEEYEIRQPIPWSDKYLVQLDEFLKKFKEWFAVDNRFVPDAIQISVGGDYGEQYLSLNWDCEDCVYKFTDYEAYLIKLSDAAKTHIDIYSRHIKPLGSELVLMAGSLIQTNEVLDEKVIKYAKEEVHIPWVQTNACISKLRQCDWGTHTVEMLKKIYK